MNTLKPGIVTLVPVTQLHPDPEQPRRTFDEDSLKTLGASLAHRVEVPLKVAQRDGKIVIVDGERRWRAAKLAKIESLPVLVDEIADEMQIRATQLTTAEEREGLAPLDIGEFLVGLHRVHKLPASDLAAQLAKRGIQLSPEKIERYMRLVELPEWTKKMLRHRTLGEPAASQLHAVLRFPAVMKQVESSCKREVGFKGTLTTREIASIVEQSVRYEGIDLHAEWGERVRKFPITACRSCEFRVKIGNSETCLNAAEFDRKQREALAVEMEQAKEKTKNDGPVELDPKKVKPRQFTVPKGKVIALTRMDRSTYHSLDGAPFNKTGCRGCPHKRDASWNGAKESAAATCFYTPCYENKKRQASRAKGKGEKFRLYFEGWLRPIVAREIDSRMDAKERTAILIWLATGAVVEPSYYSLRQNHDKAARILGKWLADHRLPDLGALMKFCTGKMGREEMAEIVQLAVLVMEQEQLRWMARYLKIDLKAKGTAYTIDAGYLAMKRKSELYDLAKIAGCKSVAGLGVAELKKELLKPEHVAKIGIPEDIAEVYAEDFAAPKAAERSLAKELSEALTEDEAAAIEGAVLDGGKPKAKARRAA